MQLKNGNFCPFIKKDCKGLECVLFTQVRGINPNSGAEIDEYACSLAWLPVLLIENAQQTRQSGAAIESFRNEMVKTQQETFFSLLSGGLKNQEPPMLVENQDQMLLNQ